VYPVQYTMYPVQYTQCTQYSTHSVPSTVHKCTQYRTQCTQYSTRWSVLLLLNRVVNTPLPHLRATAMLTASCVFGNKPEGRRTVTRWTKY